MNRFFIERNALRDGAALIAGEDAHHITSVLRLSDGDEIALCDGCGTDYIAVIEHVEKNLVTARTVSSCRSKTEPRTRVTLFQALPKAGKLETIIQKCVELGVSDVVPFSAQRSVVRLNATDFEKKRERYQRVAYEAAKQSRRGAIPNVHGLVKFEDIDPTGFGAFIFPYEEERETTLKHALKAVKRNGKTEVAFIIGPEGGFDAQEAEALARAGAMSVTLGERILRTETAGPAALAMILYELEQEE